MADYISDTQKRSSTPDRNVVLSAYTKMDIDILSKQEMESRVSDLKEWAAMAASDLHKEVEVDVQIRQGSIIAEIIISGNLEFLLDIDHLKEMGFKLTETDLVAGYLGFRALRIVLRDLIKDIKSSTAALSTNDSMGI